LRKEYIELDVAIRRREAGRFVLLGHSDAGMLCHPAVASGEAMKLVYDLAKL